MFSLNLLLLAVSACAQTITLSIRSNNTDLAGEGVMALNEGAGLSYMFLNETSEEYEYDSTQHTITRLYAGNITQYFTVEEGASFLSVPPVNSSEISFQNELLAVDGSSEGFYACKDTGDQYMYSRLYYQLMFYPDGDAPENCTAVDVLGTNLGTVSNSTAPTTTSSLTETATGVHQIVGAPETITITVSSTPETIVVDKRDGNLTSVSTYVDGAAHFAKPVGIFALGLGTLLAFL